METRPGAEGAWSRDRGGRARARPSWPGTLASVSEGQERSREQCGAAGALGVEARVTATWLQSGGELGGGDFQEVGDITVKVTSEKGDFHSGI